jgi:hypothetical protein
LQPSRTPRGSEPNLLFLSYLQGGL